jgi:hypothetical protein
MTRKFIPIAPKICGVLLMLVIPGFMAACGGGGGGGGNEITIRLSWAPNPETVEGYMIFAGATAGTTNKLVSVLPVTTPGFDPDSPSIEYKASKDLGLALGNNVCFRLKAFNSVGTSAFSDVTCIAI